MSSYTRRLGAARTPATGATVVLMTAPATGTVVIRNVSIVNIGALGGFASLFIPISGVNHYVYFNSAMAANQAVFFETRQELRPGEELRLTTATSEFSCLVTGYVFSG